MGSTDIARIVAAAGGDSLSMVVSARNILAKAATIDEAKDIADKAEALRVYYRKAGESHEAQNAAAIVKLEAERRVGELLAKNLARGRPKKKGDTMSPLMRDLGIAKKQSSRFQKLASIPVKLHDKYVKDTVESGGEVTTAGAMKLHRPLKEAARQKKRNQNAAKIASAATIDESLKAACFSTIVVDPPWDWGDEGDVDQLGRARPTYKTMAIEELVEFPIADKADTDCHLYLWITNRSLPKGFALLESWGFRYVTCLTWCKPSFGMGNYFRGQTEQVLFGVKGSLMLKRKDAGTWFSAARGPDGHSSKPQEFYDLVESCSHGPYLDVFSRRSRDGWTCWGGEV